MLIWKTNSFDIKIASVRYRCLLPSRYLESHGYKSCFYAGKNQINVDGLSQSDVLIFVKSFTPYDLFLSKKAKEAGIPIILDVCDNIFIDEYISKCKFKPSDIFKEMSEAASAIVTTGSALKNIIEREINSSVPVFIIPDAHETVEDVNYALSICKWRRWLKLLIYRPISTILLITNILLSKFKTLQKEWRKQYRNKSEKQIKYNSHKSTIEWRKLWKKLTYVRRDTSYIKNIKNNVSYQYKKYAFNSLAVNTSLPLQNSVNSNPEANPEIRNFNILENSIKPHQTIQGDEYKTILWFGNHGAKYGKFGMLNILDIAEPLVRLSQEIKFRLLVVSNNYKKYCQHIEPLPFTTEYVEWDLFSIYKNISESDVTIIPNSKCDFSICKSANRAILSLSLGVPVVATKTPALDDFNDCIILDDWERGLKAYFSNEQLVNSHLKKAQSMISSNYSGEAIGNNWSNLIHIVTEINQ